MTCEGHTLLDAVSIGRTRSSGGKPSSIQSAMNAMSASATRAPPHMNGGKRLPSNGANPRKPRIRPDRALRLSSVVAA